MIFPYVIERGDELVLYLKVEDGDAPNGYAPDPERPFFCLRVGGIDRSPGFAGWVRDWPVLGCRPTDYNTAITALHHINALAEGGYVGNAAPYIQRACRAWGDALTAASHEYGISIILTSYNRPALILRTLQALMAQTYTAWRCALIDDGSDDRTRRTIGMTAQADARFYVKYKLRITEEERREQARQCVHINAVLGELGSGIVGYLCDNVEWAPNLLMRVAETLRPGRARACYARLKRDVWSADGEEYLGEAEDFGYAPVAPMRPPSRDKTLVGMLDHSQVFHRMPVSSRWPEAWSTREMCDGLFFDSLRDEVGGIVPLQQKHEPPLVFEHMDRRWEAAEDSVWRAPTT